MKVLVTGYQGQLGWDVVRTLKARGVECRGVDAEDFDLRDAPAVKAYVREYAPDVIVHCAAYTAVDKAESEPELCAEVNGDGTMNVARAALSDGEENPSGWLQFQKPPISAKSTAAYHVCVLTQKNLLYVYPGNC